MKKDFLECGKIINTHGVAGVVKVDPWCDSPYDLADLNEVFFLRNGKYVPTKVLKASVFKRFVLLSLEGVADMDTALALKEKVIYTSRANMPVDEGSYFIADLIGLNVIDADSGIVYGTLKDVINTGASDIYEIQTENGLKMMPAVEEFVKTIDLEKGIYISPIEGMFD